MTIKKTKKQWVIILKIISRKRNSFGIIDSITKKINYQTAIRAPTRSFSKECTPVRCTDTKLFQECMPVKWGHTAQCGGSTAGIRIWIPKIVDSTECANTCWFPKRLPVSKYWIRFQQNYSNGYRLHRSSQTTRTHYSTCNSAASPVHYLKQQKGRIWKFRKFV